jgi:ankyrin repeat protein
MRRHEVAALLGIVLFARAAGATNLNDDLLTAARRGDARAVESLLDRGADVNAASAYGVTALFFAADKGHVEVVRVLLRHKAEVNRKDTFYQTTALSWAASKGHADVVRALVEAGATGADEVLVGTAWPADSRSSGPCSTRASRSRTC